MQKTIDGGIVMKLQEKIIDHMNLTIVFDRLDRDFVRRDIIRQSFDEVEIAELPEVLFLNFSDINAQVNFLDRRLHINVSISGNEEEAANFISGACKKLLKAAPDFRVTSYGYNYSGKFKSDFDFNEYLLNAFCCGRNKIKENLGTDIVLVAPVFSVKLYEAQFNIELKPMEDEKKMLDFRCNVHFDDQTPKGKEIEKEIIEYFEHFIYIMKKL